LTAVGRALARAFDSIRETRRPARWIETRQGLGSGSPIASPTVDEPISYPPPGGCPLPQKCDPAHILGV